MECLKITKFFGILLIIVLVGCATENISQTDINSVTTSIKDQRNIILKYEKQLVCENHSMCFYAIVDGAIENNPQNAITQCDNAMRGIDNLVVPSGLPVKVIKLLEESKQILRNDTQDKLALAQQFANVSENTVSKPSGECSTCSAFHKLQVVNKSYGLDDMMQGQYVNCEVLKSIR